MYPICFKLITNRTQIYATRNFSNSVLSKHFLSQYKKPEKQWHYIKLQTSNFHTTQKMHSPGLLALSIASMVSGSYVRSWWLRKTPMQQEEILKWYKNRRHIIHGRLFMIY